MIVPLLVRLDDRILEGDHGAGEGFLGGAIEYQAIQGQSGISCQQEAEQAARGGKKLSERWAGRACGERFVSQSGILLCVRVNEFWQIIVAYAAKSFGFRSEYGNGDNLSLSPYLGMNSVEGSLACVQLRLFFFLLQLTSTQHSAHAVDAAGVNDQITRQSEE